MIPGPDHYLEDMTVCQSGLDGLSIRQPATEALEESVRDVVRENSFQLYNNHMTSSSRKTADKQNPIKGPFAMKELEEVTKPIIRSFGSFPLIEWSFDGSIVEKDSSSDDDSEEPSSETFANKMKALDCDAPDDRRFVLKKLKRSSSSLTGLVEKQPQQRRLVRSKGLSRLSMLESPFLPVSRNFDDDGVDEHEPTNVADFPLSYDVEKWIELAENATLLLATNDTNKTSSRSSSSCLNRNSPSACSA